MNAKEREYIGKLIQYYGVTFQDIHRGNTPSTCCRALAKMFLMDLKHLKGLSKHTTTQ